MNKERNVALPPSGGLPLGRARLPGRRNWLLLGAIRAKSPFLVRLVMIHDGCFKGHRTWNLGFNGRFATSAGLVVANVQFCEMVLFAGKSCLKCNCNTYNYIK
jgi:hypothetical protein